MSIETLIDDFSFLESWEDRYKYLIELGSKLPHFDEEKKKEEWKISGCQSQVWIIPTFSGNNVSFIGDSDAIIVRGIIAIVLEIFKDKTAQEILSIDVEKILFYRCLDVVQFTIYEECLIMRHIRQNLSFPLYGMQLIHISISI